LFWFGSCNRCILAYCLSSKKNPKHSSSNRGLGSRSDTSKYIGKWNNLSIIQTTSEQHTRKAINQGSLENSHIGNYTHTSEIVHVKVRSKSKSVSLQAWSGPGGTRKLRFPDYMTTAQDGGKVVSPMHRPTSPTGNAPGTHFC